MTDVPDDRSKIMVARHVPSQATAAAACRRGDAPNPVSDITAATVSAMDDIVDEWGRQSFPASDPPANW
jgi:hypothetical protein